MVLRASRLLADVRKGDRLAGVRIAPLRTVQRLRQVLDANPGARYFTVRRIIAALGDSPQGPTLALFSAAGVLQVPDAGHLQGVVTCAIGAQLVLRRPDVVLPRMILMRKISRDTLTSLVGVATLLLKRAETVIHTRWNGVFHPGAGIALGVLLFLLGVASLSPFLGMAATHAASAFVMSIGLAEGDGLVVMIGALAGVASLAVGMTTAISGKRLWVRAKDWLAHCFRRLCRRAAAWLLDHLDLGELLRIDRNRLLLLAIDFAEPTDKLATPGATLRCSLKARARKIRVAESRKLMEAKSRNDGA